MRASTALLFTLLSFEAHALRRDDAGAAPDVSLRSSARKSAKDASGVFVVEPGTRVVAQVPCLGCPPVGSGASEHQSVLLFYLRLNDERTHLLVDNQPVYPSPDANSAPPTLHARQWPATLADSDISGAIADYEAQDRKSTPFGSDYVTLAYRRTIFPLAGSSAAIVQLDILGVGYQANSQVEDSAKANEDHTIIELNKKSRDTRPGNPLDSTRQQMLQLLIRRDVATNTLSIARVDVVQRLPVGRISDPARPASAETWSNRIIEAFGGPQNDAFIHGTTSVSDGGLETYYNPPQTAYSGSSDGSDASSRYPVFSGLGQDESLTVFEWFSVYWVDLAILFCTLSSAILILYIIYLVGLYVRHTWSDSLLSFDLYEHIPHGSGDFSGHGWIQRQRIKRFQAAAASKSNLERVVEEGHSISGVWDEKRRSWNEELESAQIRTVSAGSTTANANGSTTRERRSNSMPLAERREIEAGRMPLTVRTSIATEEAAANPRSSIRKKNFLPPTPVESWEEGSGWGWGWGER